MSFNVVFSPVSDTEIRVACIAEGEVFASLGGLDSWKFFLVLDSEDLIMSPLFLLLGRGGFGIAGVRKLPLGRHLELGQQQTLPTERTKKTASDWRTKSYGSEVWIGRRSGYVTRRA